MLEIGGTRGQINNEQGQMNDEVKAPVENK
jgi:hypothetical protein